MYRITNPESRTTSQESRFYIELARPEEFPVVFALSSAQESERVVSSYGTSRELKNGDKLILEDNGAISFSRISGTKSLALGIPIGINSAGIDDLVVLPGIGIKIAERIIEYRKLNGNFKSIDELVKIKGIGEKKIKAIKPFISLD